MSNKNKRRKTVNILQKRIILSYKIGEGKVSYARGVHSLLKCFSHWIKKQLEKKLELLDTNLSIIQIQKNDNLVYHFEVNLC